MKFAYWGLLAIAVIVGIFGYLRDMQWLIFVAVGILLVAVAADPKRGFFGRRLNWLVMLKAMTLGSGRPGILLLRIV